MQIKLNILGNFTGTVRPLPRIPPYVGIKAFKLGLKIPMIEITADLDQIKTYNFARQNCHK